MSGQRNNQTYFYIGADYGLAILLIALAILLIGTLIGLIFFITTI